MTIQRRRHGRLGRQGLRSRSATCNGIWPQRTLSELVFRGDERLLDVGCGDGYVTRAIAARLPHGSVVGIDASPRMIEAATARPDPAGTVVRFEVGDVLALPFVDEFDVVVSFNVLHWLVDQQAALSAIARAARPGGRVIVQQVCAGPRLSLEQLAMDVCARPQWRAAFTVSPRRSSTSTPSSIPRLPRPQALS